MPLELTDLAGAPLGVLSVTAERGTPSAHIQFKALNPTASTISDALATMFGEKTPGSGSYDTSGHPVTDERQGRLQIMGVDSSGTPGQLVSDASEQGLGYLKQAVFPPILPGNAILYDFWIAQPETSAGGGAVNVKLAIDNDAPARPVPAGVTDVARGIVPGNDTPESFIVTGCALTATGTPDDKVHMAVGSWIYQGVPVSQGSIQNITLNQNDGAAAALIAGQEYIAAISLGLSSTPTVTKGIKATVPALYPVVPIGESLIGFVHVLYHVTASVIASGNLELTDLTYGRYRVTVPATGLTATVHIGRALTANFMQRHDVKEDVVLVDASTNRIWLKEDGYFAVTTSATKPTPGALLLATATTSGGNVTGSTDERIYIGAAGSLSLHAITHHTGGTDALAPADIGAAAASDLANYGLLAGAVFTDIQVPTRTAGDNTPHAASTAYVLAALAAILTEHVATWTSDGTTTTYTLSPVPNSLSIPEVRPGSVDYVEGVDYMRTGGSLQTIDWTGHVPTVGVVVVFRWRG